MSLSQEEGRKPSLHKNWDMQGVGQSAFHKSMAFRDSSRYNGATKKFSRHFPLWFSGVFIKTPV
jgi:hypothetical protein